MGLPPPPPNLDLGATERPRILAVNIATYCLALIAVVLRFVCRRLSKAAIWWDDLLMIAAIIFSSILVFVSITWMLIHGYGKHVWSGKPDALQVWAQGLFISEFAYTGVICSIKFSLLAFYWRIFKITTIRIPIYVIGAVVSCWGIAVILVSTFQCLPVNGFWDKTINATCIDTTKFFVANSIPNIVTDAAILILPMPYIWQLQLPRTQKIVSSSIFVLGIFVVAVSITRIQFVVNLDLTSPDLTWNFVDTQIWTCVETNIGIICGCLPSLRPLLSLILTGSVSPSGGASFRSKGSKRQRNRSRGIWNRFRYRPSTDDTDQWFPQRDENHEVSTNSTAEHGEFQHVRPQAQDKEARNVNIALHPIKDLGGINKRSDIEIEYHIQSRDINL